MKYLLTHLILVLVACSPKPYYYHYEINSKRLFLEGRSLVKDGKYYEAITKLDSIDCLNGYACRFKNFYLARAYAFSDTIRSFEYLKEAVYYGQIRQFIQLEDFPYVLDTLLINKLEAEYKQRTQSNDLYNLLRNVTINDQKIRQSCSDRSAECGRQINLVDSLNLNVLDSLVSIYGWPGFTKIGFFVPGTFFPQPELVILHSDPVTCYKYLDIVRNCCMKNEESWEKYKMIVSNILMRYNYKSDSILIDFIPMKSLNLLIKNFDIPERDPLVEYINFYSSDFRIHPLNGTPENYARKIAEMLSGDTHKIIFSSPMKYKNKCKNCFLLIKGKD